MGATLIYSVVLSLIWTQSAIQGSRENTLRLIISLISFILIVLKMLLFDKLSYKEFGLFCIILPLVVVSYYSNSSEYLILAFLLIFGCKNVILSEVFKQQFYLRTIVIISMMTASYLGVIPAHNVKMIRMIGTTSFRYGFGFEHPNMAQMNIGLAIIFYFLWRYESYSWKSIVCSEIIVLITDYFTNSRTGVLATSLVLLLLLIARYSDSFINLLKRLSVLIYIISIGSVVIYFVYTNQGWMLYLNRLLQGRLWNGNYYLKQYSVNMFGQIINQETLYESTIIIDTYFLYVLLNWGVIISVILLVVNWLVYKQLIFNGYVSLALCIMFMMIYGISEGLLINPAYNITFILIGWCWYEHFEIDSINKKRKLVIL